MSEAADAEQEVEDFFNEEVLGAPTREEPAEVFPSEAPPESKPIEEVAVDTPLEPAEAPEEGTPEGTPEEPEEAPVSEPGEETPVNGEPVSEEEADTDDDHIAWAKKQYGEDLDPEKLAKAAYEKEKLLGRRAEETRALQAEREARELQERIDALNTPGILTPEEDTWVDEAAMATDPGAYAYDALQNGRPDLYAAVMDRWATLGESEARQMRALHSKVMQHVTAPQPSDRESYALALGETFATVGYSIEQHGPIVLQKLDELGPSHWTVEAIQSHDPREREHALRAVVDLISAGQTVVQKARVDDQVSARVQEEQLRQGASGITTGGPHVAPPKKSEFWDQFDDEINQRGWNEDGRPSYGHEER
jgi:hypothetical protein